MGFDECGSRNTEAEAMELIMSHDVAASELPYIGVVGMDVEESLDAFIERMVS